jgi:predicted nucleotidyltransferase
MKSADIIKKLSTQSVKNHLHKRNIKHVWLAWSYAQGEHNQSSDIDIVFEEQDPTKYDLRIFEVPIYLEEKVLWRRVDIMDRNALNPHIKKFISQHLIPIW